MHKWLDRNANVASSSIVGISRGCRAFSLPLACPFFLSRAENNGTPFRSSISIQFELAIDRAHGTDRCNFIDCPTDFSCYRVINRLNRSARIALEQLAFARRINWVRHFALLLFFSFFSLFFFFALDRVEQVCTVCFDRYSIVRSVKF